MHPEIKRLRLVDRWKGFKKAVDTLGVAYDNPFTAGGYVIATMLTNVEDSDMDVFFRTRDACEEAVRAAKKLDLVQYETARATRLKNNIDLVHYQFTDPETMIAGFDIRACMVAFDYSGGWFQHEEAISDIQSKKMILTQFTGADAITSIQRIAKYGNRGLKLDRMEAAKLALAIQHYTYPVEMEGSSLLSPYTDRDFKNEFWDHEFNKADGRGGGGY